MPKILFPALNRVHRARQQLLLRELSKYFEVDVEEYRSPHNGILDATLDITNHFKQLLDKENYELVLIRGDRFEVLPIAMLCAYKGIRLAHIEGGDKSGMVDNKVRYAVTALSDIHFATNKESRQRLLSCGTDPVLTFNFGSLDCEYAKTIKVAERKDYVVLCHHPVGEKENPDVIEKLIKEVYDGEIRYIRSNADGGTIYGKEEYSAEEYLKLIGEAKCLVGNSSSFIKEASVFGTPVVLVGERQKNRLCPENVKQVPYDSYQIKNALKMQLQATYKPSGTYYQEGTSLKIANEIRKFLSQ